MQDDRAGAVLAHLRENLAALKKEYAQAKRLHKKDPTEANAQKLKLAFYLLHSFEAIVKVAEGIK